MTDFRLPPKESQQIVLGMNESTFHALSEMTTRHQRMFRVDSLLDETQYVLMHPDEIRHVLVNKYLNYRKGRTFRNMKLLMGNGLIVQDGDFWRQQRRMIQPLFHQNVLLQTANTMRAKAAALLDIWCEKAEGGEVVNLSRDISGTTLDTLLEALFSEDLDTLAVNGRNPFHVLTEDSSRDYQFVPKFRTLLTRVLDIVALRHRQGRLPPDFLSMLMETRDGQGRPMPPEQLCDEVATLIVAGHETTASLLTWVWYLLGHHPDVEAKFHEEIAALPETVTDGDRLLELTYVRMVLLETLRLYPPVWVEDRQAVEEDWIGDFYVPPGTEIFIPIYFIHRKSEFFTQPSLFDPERFKTYKVDRRYLQRRGSAGESTPTPRQDDRQGSFPDRRGRSDRRVSPSQEHSTFIPFATGPRRCIGDQYALLNAHIHLATIGKRLRIRCEGSAVGLEPKVNLRPKGDIYAAPRMR